MLLVTYNHRDFVQTCLRSILPAAADNSREIIVVDNHSSDGTGALIRRLFPRVQLIENRKNLGFARAANQAFRESSGEFLLLLNPDILVLPGTIEEMIAYIRQNEKIGVLLPKLVNPDGSLQFSCRTFCHPFTLFLRRAPLGWFFSDHPSVRRHLMMDWDHRQPREVDWGLGACMLIRRKAVNRDWLLDERYFLYFEDIDLCFSLKRAGMDIVYYPEAVLVHHHLRQSASGLFSRPKWEHLKSMVKFYWKHRCLRPRP
ncbi:MAG: glycosyltransferase family 2 protein [Syntrophaceae bacterium]|nr:glycosyltransferase family 2 protein [Syntrophaceae bacterium]